MKLGLYVSPLGGFAPPFGHSRKEMISAGAAAVMAGIGAAASTGTAIAQNAANSANVRDTNATNLKIAYMNNMNSQQQFEKNLQWLQEQFYKQREYSLADRAHNDIGAVVNRALAAGINPSAVVGNGMSQGQSVSSVGTPSPTQFQAPHIEPAQFDFSGLSEGIGRAVDMFYENQLKNEQTKGQVYDNQIKAAQSSVAFWKEVTQVRSMMADIDEKLSHISVNSAQADLLRKQKESMQRDLFERIETFEERRKQLENGNALMKRQEQHIGVEEAQAWTEIGIKRALAGSTIKLNEQNMQVFESVAAKNWEEAKNEYYRRGSIKEGAIADKIHNDLLKLYSGEKIRELGYRNKDVWHRDAWDLANYLSGAILNGLQAIPKFK